MSVTAVKVSLAISNFCASCHGWEILCCIMNEKKIVFLVIYAASSDTSFLSWCYDSLAELQLLTCSLRCFVSAPLMEALTVTICNASHRKLSRKPTRQLNNGSAAYAPYLFNNRHRWHSSTQRGLCVLIKGFANWLNSPKMKGSPLKETMCCLKMCLWQLQNTPHKIFERVETWQFCDCLHGNGERVSLG